MTIGIAVVIMTITTIMIPIIDGIHIQKQVILQNDGPDSASYYDYGYELYENADDIPDMLVTYDGHQLTINGEVVEKPQSGGFPLLASNTCQVWVHDDNLEAAAIQNNKTYVETHPRTYEIHIIDGFLTIDDSFESIELEGPVFAYYSSGDWRYTYASYPVYVTLGQPIYIVSVCDRNYMTDMNRQLVLLTEVVDGNISGPSGYQIDIDTGTVSEIGISIYGTNYDSAFHQVNGAGQYKIDMIVVNGVNLRFLMGMMYNINYSVIGDDKTMMSLIDTIPLIMIAGVVVTTVAAFLTYKLKED